MQVNRYALEFVLFGESPKSLYQQCDRVIRNERRMALIAVVSRIEEIAIVAIQITPLSYLQYDFQRLELAEVHRSSITSDKRLRI